jgi:DNA-binding response OmpR family regulator
VILDLMLPKVDGMRVLRDMRAAGATSRVLVLSARDQIADRVEALNLGADDYLVKPFAQAELESRLQALMRRSLEAPQPQLSPWPGCASIRRDGWPVSMAGPWP